MCFIVDRQGAGLPAEVHNRADAEIAAPLFHPTTVYRSSPWNLPTQRRHQWLSIVTALREEQHGESGLC